MKEVLLITVDGEHLTAVKKKPPQGDIRAERLARHEQYVRDCWQEPMDSWVKAAIAKNPLWTRWSCGAKEMTSTM